MRKKWMVASAGIALLLVFFGAISFALKGAPVTASPTNTVRQSVPPGAAQSGAAELVLSASLAESAFDIGQTSDAVQSGPSAESPAATPAETEAPANTSKSAPSAKPDNTVSLPSLKNLIKSAAQSKLGSLGLKYKVTTATSNTVSGGMVISQQPAAGTKLKAGDTVTIVISIGGTWSDWVEKLPASVTAAKYEIKPKTQYKFCDKELKQSSSATMDGYTCYDQKITDWTAFSAWSTTVYTASDTRHVNTKAVNRTQWRYGRYLWKDAGGNWCSSANPKSGVTNNFQLSGWFDSQWACAATYGDGSKGWRHPSSGNLWYTNPNRSNYGSPSREVFDHTEYQYSDAIYTYYFFRWGSWSNWSDTKYEKTADRNIDTRVVYQYRLK